MDARSEEIISGLRQKFKAVMLLYENQKSKTTDLQQKNLELTNKATDLEHELDELKKKYEHLKISKVLASVPGEDVHETKLQVNRIVREIDKCIALLNR